MGWSVLSFLAQPWFVVPWYAIGAVGAVAVAIDLHRNNTPLKTAMTWAWPIIVFFFSIIGIALYLTTARAPGIGRLENDDEKQQAHDAYERNLFRRVNGAVIHCVAGDGLGVMTGMVIARATGMTFWQEFWFEYAVGFAFGWFIFQLKSMRMMTDSLPRALAMAFRGEFFSMLTVMAGMGAVMSYVTPLAVTQQPKPLTWAFWGFGMFGLLVGYVFTFPMNALMVKIGWKHGMGSAEGARPAERAAARGALFTAMALLGAAALVLPAWTARAREKTRVTVATASPDQASTSATRQPPLAVAAAGLHASLGAAADALERGAGENAAKATDAARWSAEVASAGWPGTSFDPVKRDVLKARRQLHLGRRHAARDTLARAAQAAEGLSGGAARLPANPEKYAGATVIDPVGNRIGEVLSANDRRVTVSVGGLRDLWGFVDLTRGKTRTFDTRDVVFGKKQTLGMTIVQVPAS